MSDHPDSQNQPGANSSNDDQAVDPLKDSEKDKGNKDESGNSDSSVESKSSKSAAVKSAAVKSAAAKLASSFFNRLLSLAKRTMQGLALLPVPLFVFSLLGRYFYFAELLCNFRGYLMIALLISIAIFLLSRRWWLATVSTPVLCWSMIGVVTVFWPASQPPAGSETIRIMSFNVLGTNFRHQLTLDQIRSADPDIISILEYSGNWHSPMDCLTEKYPHQLRFPRWHGFGIAMFSKYPFSKSEQLAITKEETDVPIIVANVDFGSSSNPKSVRLAAVHVLSPTNHYRTGLRNQQFVEVADILAKEDIPTVVMGDFNCVPWSPFIDDFLNTTNYRDSRQGFGYHATWDSRLWPIQLPIDHAFVSKHIHVHDRYVGGFGGSDHFPIIFEISLTE